ncbi:hypothetical protein MACK_003524 [Theileria orientalis]|uniref:Nucleoporin NSP1-like C-terminal domain-containing protein n=1 Tax=Theileria orientalis TaxID=68886 RepID=A0A976XJB8_THEOR|nr:hypothetical protein MACK_003524 [Theileria orientalis]
MSSPGENENNSNENNTNKPVSNIFGSSTKSSISNLFTAQDNTTDSFNDPSSSHINFGESPQVSSFFDKKPLEGDLNVEQPSGFTVAESLKSSDSGTKDNSTEMPPSVPGEKKGGVVLLTLSERIDPSLYDTVAETAPSNMLNAEEEPKSDDSHKPTDDLPKNTGLFTDTLRDESSNALDSTQFTEAVTKEQDPKVTSDVNSTQGQDHTQNEQLPALDNDLLTSPFGTSSLLPSRPFSTAKTFDLIENEHTSKMTEPSVSSNAASLTESINGQGSPFGNVSRQTETSTEELKSKTESPSIFGSLNSAGKQTSLFGSSAPSILFGNQETTNKFASNDTSASLPKFGSSTEVKSEPSLSDILSTPGTAGSSTNLFGSSTSSASNLFGSTSTNIFGSATGTSNTATSNIFGSAETPAKGSLFGNLDTSSATSVFGQASSTTATGTIDTTATTVPTVTSATAGESVLSSTTNLFGTTDKTETSTTSNLFGTTDTTGTGTSSTNLFGSSTSGLTSGVTTSSGNLFGTSGTTNLFSASSSATDTPPVTSNLFGSTDSASSTTNLFGTTTDRSSTPNLFGQPSPTTGTGITGTSTASVKSTATAVTGTSNLFGATDTSTSVSNPFGTTDSASSSNLFGTTDGASSSNLFGAKDTASSSNLFGGTDNTSSSNLFGATDTTTATATSNLFGTTATATDTSAITSNLFGTTDAVGSSTSSLFGTTDTSSTSNLFGTTTTTTMDKPSTSDIFKTAQAPASTTSIGTSGTSLVTPSTFNVVGSSATEAGSQLTSASGLLSNDNKTESLLDSTTGEQSKPRVRFNLPSDDANKDAMQKKEVVQQVDAQASMPSFTEPEQLTIGNLLDNWERAISEKVRTFNSFAERVATIDQQIVLQCNNINGLLNMHKELLEKHQKMENLMKVIEEEQKMALSVLDNMEKILSGKLESLNRRSNNYNVTQAITRNLQELTDQLASTTKATENIAQVCQPEPIFTIAKILSFHQISLIDLEKQCDEIDSRIRSMQRRV